MSITSEEFAAARRASGISQEEAATICGISRPTYAIRESHPEDYKLSDLVCLYEKMNVSGKRLLRDKIDSLFLPA